MLTAGLPLQAAHAGPHDAMGCARWQGVCHAQVGGVEEWGEAVLEVLPREVVQVGVLHKLVAVLPVAQGAQSQERGSGYETEADLHPTSDCQALHPVIQPEMLPSCDYLCRCSPPALSWSAPAQATPVCRTLHGAKFAVRADCRLQACLGAQHNTWRMLTGSPSQVGRSLRSVSRRGRA